MLLELLGLTPEQIAENESWNPKKGKRTKDLGDRVGDGIMSVLTGSNYGERVQEATKGQYLENMEDLYGDRITKTKGVAGYDDIGDLTRLTDKKIEQELRNREATKRARSGRKAATGETDTDLDLTVIDPDSVTAGGTKYLKDEKDAKVTKAENKEEGRYIDAQNLQSMMLGHQMQQSNNQFALQQSQLQLQNRREDARESRSERKDRQMMIMQMMKGLGQLGTSIAI